MAKVKPWHSTKPESEVWHNDTKCNTGNNIERENFEKGKGSNNRECKECKHLGKK